LVLRFKITNRILSISSYGDTGVDVTTDARVLFDAVRHGKNHLVRFILEASSVDIVNSRDLHGKTPLMASCYTKVRVLTSHIYSSVSIDFQAIIKLTTPWC